MIVPPVVIMPLVPVTAKRIAITDTISFVVAFFARRVFWWLARFDLRSRRRIRGRDMPRSICCCRRSIVSPKAALFGRCWIEQIALPVYKTTSWTHCWQRTHFSLARSWIKSDRFLPTDTSDRLRVNRRDDGIQ
jgi:hypothetical protein